MSVASRSGQQRATRKCELGRSTQNAQRELSDASCLVAPQNTVSCCGCARAWTARVGKVHSGKPQGDLD